MVVERAKLAADWGRQTCVDHQLCACDGNGALPVVSEWRMVRGKLGFPANADRGRPETAKANMQEPFGAGLVVVPVVPVVFI